MTSEGDRVCLAARNTDELARIAPDLATRKGPEFVIERAFDTSDFASHAAFVTECLQALGGIDIVVIGTGQLGDQVEARQSVDAIRAIVDSNFTGIATVLSQIVPHMIAQGSGHIVVLSSVAGDRGRQSNYVYGSAKSGMSAYLQGLENRLHGHNIRVSNIKLGFVDTRLIFTNKGKFLVASPGGVAKSIVDITRRGRSGVAYVPGFWRYIMLIIIHIPAFIFKRLTL
jgi:NADP-dependent 3-hydroxy acid dehydrogenase YdfG